MAYRQHFAEVLPAGIVDGVVLQVQVHQRVVVVQRLRQRSDVFWRQEAKL